MTKAMLSEYTNENGDRVAVAVFAGSPLCAETNVKTAQEILAAALRSFPGKVLAEHWDGDTCELTPL